MRAAAISSIAKQADLPISGKARRLPEAFQMIALSSLGMTLGLLLDLRRLGPFGLGYICGAPNQTFWAMSLFHFWAFPCMHIFMLLGGTLNLMRAISRRLTKQPVTGKSELCHCLYSNTTCTLLMLAGMMGGSWIYQSWPHGIAAGNNLKIMLLWMFAGMASGAALNGVIDSFFRALLDRQRNRQA